MEYNSLMKWIETTVQHIPFDVLEDIKEHFRQDIDSRRAFERVHSISSLITLLERRDCLNREEVEPLRFIVSKLKVVAERGIPYNVPNSYQVPREVIENPLTQIAPRLFPSLPSDPIVEVFDLISCEIGSKWKHLARNLGVSEGSIDELDKVVCPIRETVLQILRYSKARADHGHWKYDLMEALRKSRRADLAEKVQRVLGRHEL